MEDTEKSDFDSCIKFIELKVKYKEIIMRPEQLSELYKTSSRKDVPLRYNPY